MDGVTSSCRNMPRMPAEHVMPKAIIVLEVSGTRGKKPFYMSFRLGRHFGLFSSQFDTVTGINGWNGVDDKKIPASGT